MTIALDTSALAAVVFGEPDAERCAAVMVASSGDCLVSAATLVEAGLVIEAKQGPTATQDLHLLLDQIGAHVVPLDAEAAAVAVGAWRRFGRGRHPAGLNLGDCFSYAVAKIAGAPLLFKGDDFTKTDISQAA